MICKKIDFKDIELEESIQAYLIVTEDEIITMIDNYLQELNVEKGR